MLCPADLTETAESHCAERLVLALEGGYDLATLERCGLAHIQGLAALDLS